MWINKPVVKIVADSEYEGKRLTTFEVTYWRPLLPETNTHRVFSRNTSSSRAKPFVKRLEEAMHNTYVPAHWNSEKPGMVGGEEFTDDIKNHINRKINLLANITANYIKAMDEDVYERTGQHIHKQYLNRYLEPFIGVTQLITSTEWSNWFKLRMASDAQPEIKDVATEMFYALQDNEPEKFSEEEVKANRAVHLPYISQEELVKYGIDTCYKISVARCARISYKTYEDGGVVEKDLALYDHLYKSGHMSPFEHVAKPGNIDQSYFNLTGWRSLRYALETNTYF